PPRASKRRAGLPQAVHAALGAALAKDPEQRLPTCGALVSAAEDALGLGKSEPSRLRRSLLLAGAIVLAVAVAGAVMATTLVRGGGKRVPTRLFADANTLAQIDPATNKIYQVYRVGTDPVRAAGADYTVYVYSRGSGTITQVDGSRNRVVETTPVSPPAVCCSLYTGPVLAASQSGAWFIEGGTPGRRARLAYLPVGHSG